MKRKLITAAAALAVGLVTFAGSTANAGGPPKDVIDSNDETWACEVEGDLPPDHCMNMKSQGAQNGGVGLILVFDSETEDRWPAEGWTLNQDFDERPCNNDAEIHEDTWWSPGGDLLLCHRKPPTPPGQG